MGRYFLHGNPRQLDSVRRRNSVTSCISWNKICRGDRGDIQGYFLQLVRRYIEDHINAHLSMQFSTPLPSPASLLCCKNIFCHPVPLLVKDQCWFYFFSKNINEIGKQIEQNLLLFTFKKYFLDIHKLPVLSRSSEVQDDIFRLVSTVSSFPKNSDFP